MTDQQQRNADIAKAVEQALNQKDIDAREAKRREVQWKERADFHRARADKAEAERAALEKWRDEPARAHRITALVESLVRVEQERDAALTRASSLERQCAELGQALSVAEERGRVPSPAERFGAFYDGMNGGGE